MKFLVICVAIFASVAAQKQTEVVTRTGSYLVEETIISDAVRDREEHRSNVTDANGVVTQHVVIKLFSKGLVVSFSSDEELCFVGQMDKDDMPVPAMVFDDVTITGQVTATEGKIVEESEVNVEAVDVLFAELPAEVHEACGDRNVQVLPRAGLGEGGRVKRSFAPLPPPVIPIQSPNCGQRQLQSRQKCADHVTSSCCKQCQSSTPYCFKSYYFADVPCATGTYGVPQTGGSYGGGNHGVPQTGGSYGGGNHGVPQTGGSYGGGNQGLPQTGGSYGGQGSAGNY